MAIAIRTVEAIPFSLPLARASTWGRWGRRSAQEHVLVRVRDSEGAWGIAEATPRPSIYGETPTTVAHVIRAHYAPALEGANVHAVRDVASRLLAVPFNFTARAAIDIALHDLLARRAGITLSEQCGGSPAPVPITYMLALRDAEETLTEAQEIWERHGIRAFKVKLEGAPGRDRARLELLRERGRRDWTITVDGNELYGGAAAVALPSVLADLNVSLLEDPTPNTGLQPVRGMDGMAVAVMADEHMTSPSAVLEATRKSQITTVCIKPPRTGVLSSLEISGIARAAGCDTWIGSQGVSEIGALASAHLASVLHTSSVPADLGTFLRQEAGATLLSQPLEVVDGELVIPQHPGSGAVIDEHALRTFSVEE